MRVQKTATAQQNFQITYLPVSCLNEQNFKENIFDIKKYGKKNARSFRVWPKNKQGKLLFFVNFGDVDSIGANEPQC